MSYQVIARKYRPQKFEDVVGQEHVTTTLMNAIRAGRIAHGYIFCGPRGTGKTTLARIFAKALNCTGGPSVDFDPADPRVREITEGRSLDVLEIDGASNNGVEQVRELRDTARFAPASCRYKIYIIDEVHMLTTAAFNALLKTLEEPPAHVKFLFATTDPERVLVTILSRCQRFDLRRIPSALIAKHLAWIAGQEGVTLDDAALFAIARGAEGGMRDAESTLDQLISFCGHHIEEADVLSMFGLAARRQLLDLSRAMVGRQSDVALRLLDELARSGKDLGRLLGDLLQHFRNLLVFQVGKGDRSLLEATEAEFDLLASQGSEIDVESLTRMLEVLSQAEGQMRDAPSKRIFLEVAVLKAIQARSATSLDAVLRHLHALRQAEPSTNLPTRPALSPTETQVSSPPTTARSSPNGSPATPSSSPALTKEGDGALALGSAGNLASPPSDPLPAPAPLRSPVPSPVPPAVPPPPAPLTTSPNSGPSGPSGPSTPVQKLSNPASAPSATPSFSTAAPSAIPAAPTSASSEAPEAPVAEVWANLLSALHAEPMFQAQLAQGRAISFDKGLLTVELPEADFHLLNDPSTLARLRPRLQQAGYHRAEVKLVAGVTLTPTEAPKPAPAAPPRTPTTKPVKVQPLRLNKEEFLNDPAIRIALEVFRAQLVEVHAPTENSTVPQATS